MRLLPPALAHAAFCSACLIPAACRASCRLLSSPACFQLPAYKCADLAHLSRFPCRWKWFFYINPLSWTLYGIIVTQLGDQENLISTGGGLLPALESAAWHEEHQHSLQLVERRGEG